MGDPEFNFPGEQLVRILRMKFSQSLLFAVAAAQESDRWGSTDYYSFNYGFGGKQDAGIAFGQAQSSSSTDFTGFDPSTNGAAASMYAMGSISAEYADNLHYNGLLC